MRPIYWPDPATGHSYLIQIQVPIQKMNSSKELGMTVVRSNNHGGDISMSDTMDRPSLLLRDVATVTEKVTAGEIDRYNMRRYISLVANVEGEDLGRLRKDVERAIVAAGEKPRGLIVDIRGQLEPLSQIIKGLSFGLLMAILIIFLLLSAYFQSFLLGLISVTSIPAALTGVGLILWISGNTLNLQSFMGAIMVMGVATANAILLVTFAERARRANGGDARAAARDGAKARFRAILMTSCAMLVGMVPMGFGFTEGGEQAKPLGLAVIGGLIFSTLSTLLLLPSIFALLRGRSGIESASLDPYDPASSHYDPSTAHP
jgi:multidrug efflux pump subunit AcrB